LCGFCKCSHSNEYAALSKTPHALADDLMLVFEHHSKVSRRFKIEGLSKKILLRCGVPLTVCRLAVSM
jgi:hypothetical protein